MGWKNPQNLISGGGVGINGGWKIALKFNRQGGIEKASKQCNLF